ncbi:MAG: RNA polymerase sigma factor [Solirubrobacterales bacterium]
MSTAVATATETPRRTTRAAFEELYRSSRDDVYAYVAGLLRDRSAAEEVTSQAFERAWRKRRQLEPERGPARAWLFGIARNAALDELRRRSRQAPMPDDSPLTASGGGPLFPVGRDPAPGSGTADDPAGIAIRRTALRQAMASLSGRERELVSLKFFAGLSNAEIAAVIGTSESNAGTRLHRVVARLRRSLDETE